MINLKFLSLCLATAALISCSSGDENSGDDVNDGSSIPSGQVPDNTDDHKNTSSEPDNVNHNTNSGTPDDTGNSGNTGDSGSSGDNENSGSSGDTTSWKLVFEDNFEGTDSIPNQEYWTLTPKGDDTWNRNMSESYGQAYQKNGYLYLFGMRHEDKYFTGGIESKDKFDFKYGQVKCRARFLRQPQGNHTGIWMMPEPPAQKWPRSGEIDIMEHLDDQDVVWETVHFWDGTSENSGKESEAHTSIKVNNNEFNIYGVVWDENAISFTVNGEVKFTYRNDNPDSSDFSYKYPFTKPFYLILSQSLGGKGTWEGVINDSELPAVFQIDWIKVWQKEN